MALNDETRYALQEYAMEKLMHLGFFHSLELEPERVKFMLASVTPAYFNTLNHWISFSFTGVMYVALEKTKTPADTLQEVVDYFRRAQLAGNFRPETGVTFTFERYHPEEMDIDTAKGAVTFVTEGKVMVKMPSGWTPPARVLMAA